MKRNEQVHGKCLPVLITNKIIPTIQMLRVLFLWFSSHRKCSPQIIDVGDWFLHKRRSSFTVISFVPEDWFGVELQLVGSYILKQWRSDSEMNLGQQVWSCLPFLGEILDFFWPLKNPTIETLVRPLHMWNGWSNLIVDTLLVLNPIWIGIKSGSSRHSLGISVHLSLQTVYRHIPFRNGETIKLMHSFGCIILHSNRLNQKVCTVSFYHFANLPAGTICYY